MDEFRKYSSAACENSSQGITIQAGLDNSACISPKVENRTDPTSD